VNVTTVRSVGGTTLGTSVSVDPIVNMSSERKLNVTLVVLIEVTVAQTPPLMRALNVFMMQVSRVMSTYILGVVLISEKICVSLLIC
jgi:hypothetical protein